MRFFTPLADPWSRSSVQVLPRAPGLANSRWLRARPGFFRPLRVLLLPLARLVPSWRHFWGFAFRGLFTSSAGHLPVRLALRSLDHSSDLAAGSSGFTFGRGAVALRLHAFLTASRAVACVNLTRLAPHRFAHCYRLEPCVSTCRDSRIQAEDMRAFPGRGSAACRTRTSPGVLPSRD
jgi:hypothetical protein